jgi:hypothetical protein
MTTEGLNVPGFFLNDWRAALRSRLEANER